MTANDKALGRNHTTADTASITTGGDMFYSWARVDLRWSDGAHVSEVYDTKPEAEAHMARLGYMRVQA